MHYRVWALVLLSAVLLMSTGCHGPGAKRGEPEKSATEQPIRVPGTYVPEEVDRGSPTPPSHSSQDILAGLPMGRVLFACSSVMRVHVSERVEVRISGNPKENLVAGLKERGVPIEESAKIAPV